jgi:hypothetical protein
VADLSKAEKFWNARITDETLSDAERKEAALRANRIAKQRKKKSRYKTKAATIDDDSEPVWYPLDGDPRHEFEEKHAAWARRHPKATKVVAEIPSTALAAPVTLAHPTAEDEEAARLRETELARLNILQSQINGSTEKWDDTPEGDYNL